MLSSTKKAKGGGRALLLGALVAIVLAMGLVPLLAYAATEAPQTDLNPAVPALGAQADGAQSLQLGAQDDEGTDPTTYWDSATDGDGWYAWSSGWFYVQKVWTEGVSVKSFAWDGNTCNVVLAPTTIKDAGFTLKTQNYARSGNIYINGADAGTSSSTTDLELDNGVASITVQPRSSGRTGTTKTFAFSIEGGGVDAQYDVTLPTDEKFTVKATEGSVSPVSSKGSYSFTVNIAEGYKKGQNFAVKANDTALVADDNGVYTIENIRENKAVTVEDVVSEDTVFYWDVTLPTGAGYTAVAEEGAASPVVEGGSYSFKVNIDEGYAKNSEFAVKANGTALAADENDVYTIANIAAHQVVAVEGVQDIYAVALESGTGYTVEAEGDSSSPVFSGGNFTFKVNIAEGYKKGADFTVKVNGTAVEPNAEGVYTIGDIHEAKTVTVEDVVTVETVNKFRITLPEVTGMEIAPVEGYSSPVDEGNDYKFTATFAKGYGAGSGFAVKDNGENMVASEDGVYTLSSVSAHHDITVTDVVQLASVTAPTGSTVAAGTTTGSFAYTWYDPISTADNGDGSTTYYFNPISGQNPFYRVQHPDAVTYWDFQTLTAGKAYAVTMEDMTKGDTFTPSTVYHDFYNNYLDLSDIYLNINAQNYLPLAQGGTRALSAFRNWQAIESFTNAKIAIPDVHYEIVDIDGNPSNLVTIEPDAHNTGYATIKASESASGMAIIKVTYDAMIHKQGYASGYGAGGADPTRLGAIWPECTGIIVVTVGQDGSAIDMGMTVNVDGPIAHAGKVAGNNIDAEHDLLYYYGDEGASYTFKPVEGATVSIARSTLGKKDLSYNGFTTEGVAADAEGNVTVTGLTAGRHIVKVEKDGLANYQVLSARQITVTVKDADGNVVDNWQEHTFLPGDTLTYTLGNVNSPQEKLATCYNNSFSVAYFGEDAPTTRLESTNEGGHGYGQYNFSSMDQVIKVAIPADWTAKKTYTINHGSIALAGFSGTAAGGHRAKSYGVASGMAQGSSGAGVLAVLPDLTVNVDAKPYIKASANPAKAEVEAGATYELDLSTVFADDNEGDVLSYTVSVDGAGPVAADQSYSYEAGEAGVHELVFMAADGAFECDATYTVMLSVAGANIPPALKAGVEPAVDASIGLDGAFNLNLEDVFVDVDGDALTYTVSVDGADPVAVEADYVFTPTGLGKPILVFTANDDKGGTVTHTVNLAVLGGTDPTSYWDNTKDGNNWVGRNANYCYVTKVSAEGVRTWSSEWTNATTCDIKLIPETAPNAKFDFTVTNYKRANGTNGVRINGKEYTGDNRTVEIALVDGKASVTVQPYGYNTTVASYQGTTKTFNFTVEAPPPNVVPALADGVEATAAVDAVVGEPYELDLSAIFADADGDELAYKVKVGEAEPVEAAASYSFTPEAAGTYTLVFTANDGKVDSEDTYTLTLSADTRPTLKGGVEATAEATVELGSAYELDLSAIFADADGDELAYKVKVGEAEPVEAAASYSFTPEAAGTYTLVFTANDGKVDSTDVYTVTLKAKAAPTTVKINLLAQVEKNTLAKALFDFEVSSDDAAKYGYSKPEAFEGVVTMADAAAALHYELYGENFADNPTAYLRISSAGTCTLIFEEPTYMNGFRVNDVTPEYPDQPGTGSLWNDTPLANGDNVRIFKVNGESYGLFESYLMFDKAAYVAHEGEAVDVAVSGDLTFGTMMGMSANVAEVEGATVFAVTDFTKPVETKVAEAVTGEDGVAKLEGLPAGDYYLVVTAYENDYEEDCFSTPYATVRVSAHEWGAGSVTRFPTFDTDGEMTYACEIDGCEASKTEAIPAYGFTVSINGQEVPAADVAIAPEGYDASYTDWQTGNMVDSHVPLATVTVPSGTESVSVKLNDSFPEYQNYIYDVAKGENGYVDYGFGDQVDTNTRIAYAGVVYDAILPGEGRVYRVQTAYDANWTSYNLYAIAFEVIASDSSRDDLAQAIADAKATSVPDASDAAKQALDEAIAEAETVAGNPGATESQVSDAKFALEQALKTATDEQAAADKQKAAGELTQAIADAKAASLPDASAAAKQALGEAILNAESALANELATAGDLAAAKSALQAALKTAVDEQAAADERAAADKQKADANGLSVGSTFTVKDKVGTWTYKVTAAKQAMLTKAAKTKKKGKATINTVAYKGVTYSVTAIGPKALKGSKLKAVTVGDNVTTIGAQAFAKSKLLKTFTAGRNVAKIGAKAFAKAKKLKKITVKSAKLTTPASVKGCLKGSKVKTVKLSGVKGAAKKQAKKAFKKAGKKVKVK